VRGLNVENQASQDPRHDVHHFRIHSDGRGAIDGGGNHHAGLSHRSDSIVLDPASGRPLVQTLFNIATLVTSVAVSFGVSHALDQGRNVPVELTVAVCTFFVLNTGMVSLVLSAGRRATASEAMAAVLSLVLSVLPGGRGNRQRDHDFRPHGGLEVFPADPAGDVHDLLILPSLSVQLDERDLLA